MTNNLNAKFVVDDDKNRHNCENFQFSLKNQYRFARIIHRI